MSSWVYVFSKFTPEALLFEALIIFALCAGYAAFWVLRKRRMGSIKVDVPAGVVKTYLNDLIIDAEHLRTQLFGLLAAQEAQATGRKASTANLMAALNASGGSPELQQKMLELEAQMAAQSGALQSLETEKTRLEEELASAKATGGGGGAAVDNGELNRLKSHIEELKSKLDEYSVIEDDLANLKRLQQENAQLKSQLASGGGAPAGATAAAAPIPAPAAPAPVAAPAAAAAEAAPAAAPAPAPAGPTPEALAAANAAVADFDALFNQVEDSLKDTPPEPQPAAAADAPTAATSAAAAPPAEESSIVAPPDETKKDEDLIAEFEKMLNG